MNRNNKLHYQFRVWHRYLGFFLAGIMAVYAISGILMIFRETNFLKKEVILEIPLEAGLSASDIGPELKTRIKFEKAEGDLLYFDLGKYNIKTGIATVKKMELPFILSKMERLHKATTESPLFFLNIFFGLALLFYVISAFWMFLPGTAIFKKGLYFAIAGILLTLILLFI